MPPTTRPATSLKALAHRALRRTGIEVGRSGSGRLPMSMRRSFRPSHASTAAGGAVWIDLDQVTSYAGFSYRVGGWHPYRETAEWLLDNDLEGSFAESPLFRYYDRFRPDTVADVLFGPGSIAAPLDSVAAWQITQLWSAGMRSHGPARAILTVSDHVGPIRPTYGEAKIDKIRRLLVSMSTHGYQPLRFDGGISEGIFLVDDRDRSDERFVFLPTEGQHRLGVLAALDYREALVRPRITGPTVRRSKLHRWATAWDLERDDPLPGRAFDFYFTSDGALQVQRWDLR